MIGFIKWIIILICVCICFPVVYKVLDGLLPGGRKKDEKNKTKRKKRNKKKSHDADSTGMDREELLREINKLEQRIDNLNEILRERNNGN